MQVYVWQQRVVGYDQSVDMMGIYKTLDAALVAHEERRDQRASPYKNIIPNHAWIVDDRGTWRFTPYISLGEEDDYFDEIDPYIVQG